MPEHYLHDETTKWVETVINASAWKLG